MRAIGAMVDKALNAVNGLKWLSEVQKSQIVAEEIERSEELELPDG